MTSLTGIEGYQIAGFFSDVPPATRRSHAHLPDVVGNAIDKNALLPVFKAFWRVFGVKRPA